MAKTAPSRITITAALPYTNGPIHIGHLAGVYVPADIYARYQRLQGKDIAFICGSDEHGVAIPMKAKKEGVSPKEIIDKYHGIIEKSFQDFGISFDHYSRTSAPIHYETASDFFKKLYAQGDLMRKHNSFWQIVLSPEPARVVVTTPPMATNVRIAVPPLMQRT